MIYEKRCGADRINNNVMSCTFFPEMGADKCERGKGEVVTRDECAVKKPVAKKRNHGKSSHGVSKFVSWMLVLCVVLGVAYVDAKLLNSAILVKTAEMSRSFADAVLENEPLSDDDVLRTLYTLDYAEDSEDITTEIVSEETSAENQIEVGAVSEARGYADGVRLLPITEMNLSADGLFDITNETKFSPDIRAVSKMKPSALDGLTGTEEPLVLVLHTHACESYTQYEGSYPENEETRSEDVTRNVVAVGKEICDTLADFGVSAVHCTKLHDGESFINAYSHSASSVKRYLEEYPSVRFVIDVHRDAIIRDDGESIKAVTDISGEKYAQLMFVVGTNQLGHNHPNWQDNLSLALTLQESIDSTYPSLCRNINLRNVPFNQQLSTGYLLLEVGTSANTLEEARRSARAFGQNLARVIMTA